MKNKKLQKNIANVAVFMIGFFILLPIAVEAQNFSSTRQIVRCDGVNIPCDDKQVFATLQRLLVVVISIGVALIAVAISWAGFLYMTAAGDTGKISRAHEIFKKAAVGFALMVLAFLIVELLFSVFGVKTGFNPFGGGGFSR